MQTIVKSLGHMCAKKAAMEKGQGRREFAGLLFFIGAEGALSRIGYVLHLLGGFSSSAAA